MFEQEKCVYFVGIGGIGMSGLAEILLNMGYHIAGSDMVKTDITERLETLGAKVFYKHSSENICKEEVQMVVYSAAVPANNPELIMAQELGIPTITRGELLADIMRLKRNAVGVAGAHGKTTTTSFIYNMLEASDIETTGIIGGVLVRKGTNACWGKGDYLVAETDEHDGSFLKLFPSVSVVTNIDEEHMEYYPTLDHLKDAFVDFIHKVPFYGFSVLCLDDKNVRDILPRIKCNKILYGLSPEADIRAENIEFSKNVFDPWLSFDVHCTNKRVANCGKLGSIFIRSMGLHNVLNALAAVSVGIGLGLDFKIIKTGLRTFNGIKRRFEIKKHDEYFTLIEDYAHHPNEIKSVVNAVKHVKKNRLVIMFQPHLFSRTKYFEEEFAKVLSQADHLIVVDIYPAREQPIEGVHSKNLVELTHKYGNGVYEYVGGKEEALARVQEVIEKGDIVFILGAGDIYKVSDKLAKIDLRNQHVR